MGAAPDDRRSGDRTLTHAADSGPTRLAMTWTRDQLLAIAEELYALVNQLETAPAGPTASLSPTWAGSCSELLERVQGLSERMSAGTAESLRASLERLAVALRAAQAHVGESAGAKALQDMRLRLADSYEHLVATLRSSSYQGMADRLRSLRPRNYARNLFHVSIGLVGVLTYEFLLPWGSCVTLLVALVSLWAAIDITRRLVPRFNELIVDKALKAIVRPRERYQIPAATWYTVSLLAVTAFAEQTVAQLSVLVVAFGDPAASIIGKRWGQRKIWRRKSWLGSLAFLTVAFAATLGWLLLMRPLPVGTALAMAGVAALAGAVAELLSDDRVDDNLSVPIVAALALAVVF